MVAVAHPEVGQAKPEPRRHLTHLVLHLPDERRIAVLPVIEMDGVEITRM